MLILMAAMTGMRLGELRALRWSDIDYRAMKIKVRREYVRGQYDTRSRSGQSGASCSPLGSSSVRVDVRKIRVHDLRHTFGTTMATSGKVSLRTLQEWMGHEEIRTTETHAD